MIIPKTLHREPGIQFFTPPDFSQQLAYMRHPAGKIIAPHCHLAVKREVHFTQEVLVIKRGRVRVDFYSQSREYLESRVLTTGDIILLVSGGHGFEALEELEMIEIKQGPYAGESDKERFSPVDPTLIRLPPAESQEPPSTPVAQP